MKKTLSILLACVMLISCIPLSASALDWSQAAAVISTDTTVSADDPLTITGTYTVSAGLTVERDATVTIKSGATLTIAGSGRLVNAGTITVENGGTLQFLANGNTLNTASLLNETTGVITVASNGTLLIGNAAYAFNRGTFTNPDRTTVNGRLYHAVTVPGNFSDSYPASDTYNRSDITTDYKVYYCGDTGYITNVGASMPGFSTDTGYVVSSEYVRDSDGYVTSTKWNIDSAYQNATSETTLFIENGRKLYLAILPDDPLGANRFVDSTRMTILAGGQLVTNDRSVFQIVPYNSMSVSVGEHKYSDIVRLYEIELPRTDGYYVVSKDGDVDTVSVEYGKTFSFRVVLSEDYDESVISVYLDTETLEPDEFGYYDVNYVYNNQTGECELATAGGIQGDFEIFVMGVASNKVRDTIGDVVSFIQQIFSIIKSIFEYFQDLFSGIGSIGG